MARHEVRDDEERLVELSQAACMRLLSEHYVGRLALNHPEGPLVVPVNYAIDEGTIVFRTSLGAKLRAAEDREVAGFEVDHVDLERGLGWSVLVRGQLVEVTDERALEHVQELELAPFAGGTRDHYVSLQPTRVTGRRIPLPRVIPTSWHHISSTNTWFGRDGDDLLG